MNNRELDIIQSSIGYRFNNTELLVAAFTHTSFVNEHKAVSNERIEFLGDCVLNFLVGERLFFQDPTAKEGKLSSRRSALVSRAPLARIIDNLGFLEYLQVSAGVDKSKFEDKARSDIFEAIVGAVYIDGGLDACKTLLDNIFYGKVEPESDYKSALQEYATAKGLSVDYDTDDGTDGLFSTIVTVGDRRFDGKGRSKHASQIDAAKNALNKLKSE